MSAPAIGLVVVNFGSHTLIEQNLGDLDLAALDAMVVVVDNFRDHAASRAMAQLAAGRAGWALITQERNTGFGSAVNAGAAHALAAGCEVLVVLNPDLGITPDALAQLAAGVRADPTTMVSPRVVRPSGETWFEGAYVDLEAGRARSVPGPVTDRTPAWLSGACLAVHRDLWQKVGGFDPEYFLYWEDVDLSVRVTRAGGALAVRTDLSAVHDVGGTQHGADQRAKSPVYYYYNCRNRLVFAARHLGRRDRLRWLLRTPADVRRVVLRGGRRQLLAAPHLSAWPAARGALAGVVQLARSVRSGESKTSGDVEGRSQGVSS